MAVQLGLALVAASVLNLDRLALGQNAIGRPLVAGMLVGLIVGQTKLGLTLGLWAEVLWLVRPPLGGAIIPNGGLAVSAALVGVAGCLSWLGLPQDPEMPLPVLALAMVVPLAHYLTTIETVTRWWGKKAHARLTADLKEGLSPKLIYPNLVAVGLTFGAALGLSVLAAIAVALGMAIAITWMPPGFWPPLRHLEKLAPLLCLAYMGMGLSRRKLSYYALATVIILAMLSLFLLAND
jgi:PTS system mannose-specific IIC component